MRYLRQSTAATVLVGPFLDKADGVTEKTALTSQTGRITKAGTAAAFTPASWAHDANGNYLVGLSTGHTDTVGRLRVGFQDAATYLPVWEDFHVLSAAVYDWLFGATAPLTDKAGFSLSQAFPTNFAALAITGAGAVTAGTVGDKSGYSLATNQAFNVTGTWTGNLTGSVGSIAGVTFPANFGSLGINPSGHVSRVTLVDTTTANADMRGTDGALTVGAYTAPDNTTLGRLSSALEIDGAGPNYRFTAAALVNAPTGGGSGVADWTAGEKEQIRYALGLTGTKTATAGGTLDTLLSRIDVTLSSRSAYDGSDTAGTTALLARLTTARAAGLDNLDATITSRLASGAYTAPDNAGVASILALAGTSGVKLDLAQAVPTSNGDNTVGDCLNAARADGFGDLAIVGDTLTLKAPDGTTAVHAFTLDDPAAPTSRTTTP